MKTIKKILFVSAFLIGIVNANAQDARKGRAGVRNPGEERGESGTFSITTGAGIANYFGDLMQGNHYFSQPNYSFSAGAIYSFSSHISARFDVGFHKVQAADSKNKGAQYKARNLSFSSNVFDLSLSAEYNILDNNKYKVSPYLTAGVGIMFFKPYAKDVTGKKQSLRELGTDGQGLAGYPGIYKNSAVEFPLGFGVKYPVTERITLALEFNYRFTGTDYLDDVSKNAYTDKALLDARNPLTAKFTWRGNEVGEGAYPKNLNLARGNPKHKDGYYTTQIKVAFKL